jgi:hypothetical protein
MLQEYFMKDSEHTFFGFRDYCEQKKREKDAPYDNISMSPDNGDEVKVDSFACFEPNKNLRSSPVVCPSLLQWVEYLLPPAMETDKQKIERLQELGEKPMKRYNMTHTTMRSCPTQENTAKVVTTSSKKLANVVSTTVDVMPDEVNRAFLETLVTTSPNASAEEEPTMNITPSVVLLYRIGEALQAAKKTCDSYQTLKRKPPGFLCDEAKVQGEIASLVQLVQSINEEEHQLDFAAAMDWLERESKTDNSLVIDLTRPGDDNFSSDDSSASSEHNSDDSNYMEGGSDSKPRHKKRTSHNKQKTPDDFDSPRDKTEKMNILSRVCVDIIEETSMDDEEEMSVNESNESNTNFPDDLLNGLFGKTLHNDDIDDESGKDGHQHRDNSGGLEERQDSDKSLKSPSESEQDDKLHIKETDGNEQPDQDGSTGHKKMQESQQLHSPGMTEKDTMSKSQRKRLRKKEKNTEMRKKAREEDQESDHESNRNNQCGDSADDVDKQRKKQKKKKNQSSYGI